MADPVIAPGLAGLIRESARRYPRHPAILTGELVIDHATVGDLSDRVAAGLAGRGLQPGDRVALYCPNVPEFPIFYAGILKAGAVVVPVNLLINAPEIAFILNDAGVRGVIVHESLSERLDGLTGQIPSMDWRVSVGATASVGDNLAGYLGSVDDIPVLAINPGQDLAAILYTSGTTGFPKGAMLSHANLAANVSSVNRAMQWQAGQDRVLVVLPMFHAFAATVGMLTPLCNGCAIVPLQRFEPDGVAEAIHRHQATIFLGVPSMYGLLLRLRDERVGLMQSLRFGIVGGAAMPVSMLQAFEAKFGICLYEGDGPTECSPVTCVNPVGGVSRPGTVGLPVPDVEMKIVGDDGAELPDGQVGEIAVRGPNVMQGYWRQPEATAEVFRGDWFLTGDLGTRDEAGYFSIVDRKKDLIIVNGMNVYPRMIEEVLYRFPGLREAAVVPEHHELHGEVPVAYVVLDPVPADAERALREHCRNSLGRHQVPRRFVLMSALPRNAAGKIMKRELSKQGETERGVTGL